MKGEDGNNNTIVDFVRAYDYNGNPEYTQYAHKTTRSELYGTQTGASPVRELPQWVKGAASRHVKQ